MAHRRLLGLPLVVSLVGGAVACGGSSEDGGSDSDKTSTKPEDSASDSGSMATGADDGAPVPKQLTEADLVWSMPWDRDADSGILATPSFSADGLWMTFGAGVDCLDLSLCDPPSGPAELTLVNLVTFEAEPIHLDPARLPACSDVGTLLYNDARLSRDGRQIAVRSAGRVFIWNLYDESPPFIPWEGHGSTGLALAGSPNPFVLSSSIDGMTWGLTSDSPPVLIVGFACRPPSIPQECFRPEAICPSLLVEQFGLDISNNNISIPGGRLARAELFPDSTHSINTFSSNDGWDEVRNVQKDERLPLGFNWRTHVMTGDGYLFFELSDLSGIFRVSLANLAGVTQHIAKEELDGDPRFDRIEIEKLYHAASRNLVLGTWEEGPGADFEIHDLATGEVWVGDLITLDTTILPSRLAVKFAAEDEMIRVYKLP